MKKVVVLTAIILVLSLTVTGVFAFAECLLDVEGAKWCYYPISVDGVPVIDGYRRVLRNDYLYIPLREFCESLNMKVEWDDTSRSVSITTSKDVEYSKNFDISPETALKLAEVYFESEFGTSFMNKTIFKPIKEHDNVYEIWRSPKDSGTVGGGGTIYISKKNGQLLKAELGE